MKANRFYLTTFKNFSERFVINTQDLKHADSLSSFEELVRTAETTRYYLSETGKSGFGITQDGTLVALHSTDKSGRAAIKAAIQLGAYKLDCFAGYLSDLYSKFGFEVVRREPNWTPGGPDVVWMER